MSSRSIANEVKSHLCEDFETFNSVLRDCKSEQKFINFQILKILLKLKLNQKFLQFFLL